MSRSMRMVGVSAGRRSRQRQHLPRKRTTPSRLTVQRIFGSGEFEPEHVAIRWLADSSGYVTLEPSSESPAAETWSATIRRPATSRVLVSAAELIPPKESSPLSIEDYAFSRDRSRLLVFTNTKRVWRANTRGDYWVLDRAGPRAAQAGRRRCPVVAHARQVCPERLAGGLCAREQHLCRRPGRRPDHQADETRLDR